MIHKAIFLVPRLIEITETEETSTDDVSAGGITSMFFRAAKGTGLAKAPMKPVPTEEAEADQKETIPCRNLGGAFVSYKFEKSLRWCRWRRCGIVLFAKADALWVVIDSDESSNAIRVRRNDLLILQHTKISITLLNTHTKQFSAILEFNSEEQAMQFWDNWNWFVNSVAIPERRPSILVPGSGFSGTTLTAVPTPPQQSVVTFNTGIPSRFAVLSSMRREKALNSSTEPSSGMSSKQK
ncbi:hypothetical protein HDU76_013188 [Blyttiomyces sp. JEL0837]|nr:hypothetical protein HDU76_013188 [Blyttiomyces sp. JEL0837]